MLHLGHSRGAGVARVVITLSLSLVLAVVSYHFLEKPFLSLKRYFPARQKRPDPTTSVAVTSMPAIDLILARRAS
jgi:peptidoglycan/LPS O-acetylase OafA/YrhL